MDLPSIFDDLPTNQDFQVSPESGFLVEFEVVTRASQTENMFRSFRRERIDSEDIKLASSPLRKHKQDLFFDPEISTTAVDFRARDRKNSVHSIDETAPLQDFRVNSQALRSTALPNAPICP